MYSKIFLAGTLAIILFGGLNVTPAFAQQALVDNFTQTDDTNCDITISNPATPNPNVLPVTVGPQTDPDPTPANTIGGDRTCTTTVTVDTSGDKDNGGGDSECMTEVAPGLPLFILDSDSLLDCETTLKYGANGALNEDWSGFAGGVLRIEIDDTDASAQKILSVTVTLADGDSSFPVTMTTQITGAQNLDFTLNTFFNNGITSTDVDMITVFIDPALAGDLDIKKIFIPQMIGGTIMPADSTALLLAGAELNAFWILPAIAAIGIGAFIVSRKRN